MYAIEQDPTQALPPQVAEDGNFILRTGDAVCDEWEKEIAKTGTFNPYKQMSLEDQESTKKFLEQIEKTGEMTELPERFRTKR